MLRLSVPIATLLCAVACAPPPKKLRFERAFVSETATGTIAVINLKTAALEQRIEVGLLPHNEVVSPDGRTLYVALAGSQAVAVIDTASATLTDTWLTAPVPQRRDDGTVIQPHIETGAFSHVTCFDCHRDAGAKPRYVGSRPVALRLSADGTRLYVCQLVSGEIVALDTTTGTRLAANVLAPVGDVKEPAGIDLFNGEVYVSLRATQPTRVPGVIRRLDPDTLMTLGDLPSTSTNPVDVTVAGGALLITHFDSDQLSLLGAHGEASSIGVANGPLGIAPLAHGKALIMGYYSNAISIVDVAAGQADTFPFTLADLPLPNPTHAAVGADPNVAWIVQSGTDSRLVALDMTTHRVVQTVPINGLSYDVAIVTQK